MKIDYSPLADKSLLLLEKGDKKTARKIARKIAALAIKPFPPGARKLRGKKYDNSWRIRVDNYRVIYTVDEGAGIVEIINAAHRSKVYD